MLTYSFPISETFLSSSSENGHLIIWTWLHADFNPCLVRVPTGEDTKPGNPQEAWIDAFSPQKSSADFFSLLWGCFAAVQYLLDMSNDENIYDVEHC